MGIYHLDSIEATAKKVMPQLLLYKKLRKRLMKIAHISRILQTIKRRERG